MARCPACKQSELDPEGSCPSCGQSFAGTQGTIDTLSRLGAPAPTPLGRSGSGKPGAFLPGLVLGGRYQVVRLLGRGGMGEVWQALDLKLRVDVALKRLRPEWVGNPQMLERLRGEARAARDVVSPNVCRIFDLIEMGGDELVSMEFVDGTTLSQLLRERGPLEPREAMEIASQFLAGLEAIHQAGFVHRDVKPDNVMITRAGRVVVMDFGLARPQADERTLTLAGTPAYMAPEQLHGSKLDGRADLFAAGIVLAEMLGSSGTKAAREAIQRGAREDPPRLPDSPWRPVLLRAVAERREARWASARELMRALEQVALRVEGAEALRPYPGLASFTESDAEYFFGRELEVEALWHKLGQAHLLAVIGPSGAGKSSFLRAGLLPAMPAGWHAVIATPGTRPFAALAHALADEFPGDTEAMHDLLRIEEPEVALRMIRRWRERHGEALLIVDQFEELFTLNSEEAQARFAELLGRIALEADVHVLLSLRDDFLVRCQVHLGLAPIFSELTPLNPPTGAALRRAVVQPALQCGYRFEDEDLAAEMLDAVARERGALPLLAFAAAQLWEERDRASGLLTRAAYARIGGVGGALARHAEATVERIGSEHVPIVRELFRNLVTAQGTRAVRDYDDLLSVFGERRDEAEKVLRGLIDARLLVEYEERAGRNSEERPRRRVEIIHESLLAAWPRLERWQTQDAEGAVLRDQLRQAAATWEEHSRASDLLWTGTAYQEFSVWQERYPGGLTATEQAFAEAMKAETQRRRRRRRIAVSAAFAVLVAVLAVVTALWRQSEQAKQVALDETRRSQASQLLALGRVELEREPTAALAYIRKSLELNDTPEARRLAIELLWRGPVARILTPESLAQDLEPADRARWEIPPILSPDGNWLAIQNAASGRIYLFPSDGAVPHVLPKPPAGNANAFAFGPRSDLFVTRGEGSSLRLLSLPDGSEARSVELGGIGSRAWVAGDELMTITRFSPEDATLSVRAWPLPEGAPREVARFDPSGLKPWTLDPSGRWIAHVKDGALHLRATDASRREPERVVGTLPTESADVKSLRFSSDGETLVSEHSSGNVRLWSLAGGLPATPRVLHNASTFGVLALDRDATHASIYQSLWDLREPPDAPPARIPERDPRSAWFGSFDPSGRWFVHDTGLNLRFWPLSARRRLDLRMNSGGAGAYGLIFTPDGRRLVSCPLGRSIHLWPLGGQGGSLREILPEAGCWAMALDPAGEQLVVGTYMDPRTGRMDGRVFLIPVEGGPSRVFRPGWEGLGTFSVAFDRTGRRVLAMPAVMAYQDLHDPKLQILKAWDLDSGRERTFSLSHLVDPAWQGCSEEKLVVAPDGSLYCGGVGGILRLVIPDGLDGEVQGEIVFPDKNARLALSRDGRHALIMAGLANVQYYAELHLLDLETRTSRRITTHGSRLISVTFDPSGTAIVTGDWDGIVRVGPASGEEPHLLLGHADSAAAVATSQDGRWVASASGGVVILWPMPDLTQPPLHVLPHDALMAKLDALTNLRVVADPSTSTGWKTEIGPFPGWKDVPSW